MLPNAPSSAASIEEKFARFPEIWGELDCSPDGGTGWLIPHAEFPMTFLNEHQRTMGAIATIAQKDSIDPVLQEFEQEFDALLSMIQDFLSLRKEAKNTREIVTGINNARIGEIQASIRSATEANTPTADLEQELTQVEKRMDIEKRFIEAQNTLLKAFEKFRNTIIGKIRRHAFSIKSEGC